VKDFFRWNEWNSEHVQKQGSSPAEAESVVRNAGRGYPRRIGDDKFEVIGRGNGNRFVRVLFIESPAGVHYIIHAMPLITRRRRSQ
jgi:hypothetical protein